MSTPSGIPSLTFEFARRAQAQLMPILEYQDQLERSLGEVIEEKEPGHLAYKIDEVSHSILLEVIHEAALPCRLFSEEGGWISFGAVPTYRVICDPFCNTSLAMRSFRESAAAICMVDKEGHFVSCAIADLNVRRIFYSDLTGTFVYYSLSTGDWQSVRASVSRVRSLSQAFVVVSALKQRRREWLVGKVLFTQAAQIHVLDGAIFLARLASGYIDAYLDPSAGQPLYEIPCLEMVKQAGGVVSDVDGADFDLAHLFTQLEEDPKSRYRFVAAATPELHRDILDTIR